MNKEFKNVVLTYWGSIKSLRKKVYKKLFYYLLDLDDEVSLAKEKAYERIKGLKRWE